MWKKYLRISSPQIESRRCTQPMPLCRVVCLLQYVTDEDDDEFIMSVYQWVQNVS